MRTDERTRTAAPLVARRASDVDVSVLVPAKDEAENLPLFMELAATAFAASPAVRYEVVVVDDGSVDESWAVLAAPRARVSLPPHRAPPREARASPMRSAPDI